VKYVQLPSNPSRHSPIVAAATVTVMSAFLACSSAPADPEPAPPPAPAKPKLAPKVNCYECYNDCEGPYEGCIRDAFSEAEAAYDAADCPGCPEEVWNAIYYGREDAISWCAQALENCQYTNCRYCS
jgi:hypothetical protein